jgi:hypothetical protein
MIHGGKKLQAGQAHKPSALPRLKPGRRNLINKPRYPGTIKSGDLGTFPASPGTGLSAPIPQLYLW